MKLVLPAFENNQSVPVKYTCQEEKRSPPVLHFGNTGNSKELLSDCRNRYVSWHVPDYFKIVIDYESTS